MALTSATQITTKAIASQAVDDSYSREATQRNPERPSRSGFCRLCVLVQPRPGIALGIFTPPTAGRKPSAARLSWSG